ncbi:hypothetical protein DM01DRAFT_1410057 [Hesseltinella vesiculosa]|uniref:SMAD/FHA domain-containing protein n=1 Tax=Hesseltinella vesiculosa TaxID=101127 RepID=A0A1X2G8X4_9FUNG|nr:hypothetical protein DM01DRAFT_1410057 [Hesseltinella vesiculosa]
MADGSCVAMYAQPDESIPNTSSSLRRLSHGAHYLRRLSRSFSQETPSPSSLPSADPRRRSTFATSSSVDPSLPRAQNLHIRIVPNIENPSRSLIFDIFDRELEPGVYIKVGRFTDRTQSPTHMSFKSKVVSRSHCEFWVENGKLFIRDTNSSSGTFLNHIRISPPSQQSQPQEIKDGDIVQLGVDYQGGIEEIYRSVKMRFEVNRTRRQRPLSFNMTAFQNIRNLTSTGSQIQDQTASSLSTSSSLHPPPVPEMDGSAQQNDASLNRVQHMTSSLVPSSTAQTMPETCQGIDQVEECCICLYALAPNQALFVSPCAHTYHYKCIRPLLESYPGFQCPICRAYSDLEANTNLEAEEVIEKYGLQRHPTLINHPTTDAPAPLSTSQSLCSHVVTDLEQPPLHEATARDRRTVIVSEQDLVPPVVHAYTHDDLDQIDARDPLSPASSTHMPTAVDQLPPPTSTSSLPLAIHPHMDEPPHSESDDAPEGVPRPDQPQPRRASTSGFVEKLKMVFFEKRKSSSPVTPRQRKRSNRPRPLSYPNFLMRRQDDAQPDIHADNRVDEVFSSFDVNTSTSSSALPHSSSMLVSSQTLSRQSTTHLPEIVEVDELAWQQSMRPYQPMSVDG